MSDPVEATKRALQLLVRRHQALTVEIDQLDTVIAGLCAQANPALLAATGVGPEVAATLLVATGDHPHRMGSEASYAARCAANPVEASSGKVVRHRLNQGGNRGKPTTSCGASPWSLTCDPRTQDYATRRKTDGEIIRSLTRYIAREIYRLLIDPPTVLNGSISAPHQPPQESASPSPLGTWPTRISELERGLKHNADLATRYQTWLTTQQAT